LKNTISASIGTDNYYSGMIDVGDELGESGNLQYRVVVGVLDADRAGWNYDFNHVQMIAPSFAYDISDKSRVRVRFELANTDVKNSTTAMDANGVIVKEFSSFGPETPRNHFNSEENQSMQMVWETQMSDEWSSKMNIFGALGDKTFDQVSLTGQGAATDYLFNAFMAHYWWKNFYVDYSVSWLQDEIANTGISSRTVGSLSMDHWDISYRIFDGNLIPPYSTYRINPAAPDWSLYPATEYTYPTRYILYNAEWLGGASVEQAFGFFKDKLLVTAALRFNYDNRSSHTITRTPQNQNPGGVYTGNPTSTNINEKVTKRFGLVYKPTEKVAVYAGSTEAFLAVGAIFKADGSRLDPETGKNEEVGVKVDFLEALGGNFSFTGALFRVNVVNKWRGDPNNVGFFIQDGAQENKGVDMQVAYTSQKLSVIAGFFNADGPVDKLTGQRAVIVPDTTWNLWGKYNVTDRFSIGGGFRHQGDTLSNNRLFTTEPYTTTDLFIGYTMPLKGKSQVSYRLGVSNLTDEDAVMIISSAASIQREEGRRVKLTANYTW
jgi:outer membrane receptor for monomeric catechols